MSSTLLDIFATLPDRRRAQGKMYALAPVLMVSVLAVLSGATSYRKIHGFIDTHLSRFNSDFDLGWRRAPAYRGSHLIAADLANFWNIVRTSSFSRLVQECDDAFWVEFEVFVIGKTLG